MLKSRSLRKAMAILCALCMLFSIVATGFVALAADDEVAAEATAIEQADDMDADGTEFTVEEIQEISTEQPDPTQPESNSLDETRVIAETTDPGETAPVFPSSEGDVRIESTASPFSEYGVIGEPLPAAEDKEAPVSEPKAPRSATSNNLSDFLTDVMINAPTDESGNYIINPNSAYEMTLKFSENEGLQFEDESVLVYNFPDGVIMNDIGATSFSITVVDENGTAIVYDNIFEVIRGQLQIHFNQGDPNFERLKAMPNVSFSITFSSSFDESAGEIIFNENIAKDFVYEESSDLTIDKSVVYDMESDTAYYELQIRSDGQNDNVVIEDHLSGTALIFNQDVALESSVNGTLSVTPDYASVDNGFRVTIPQTVDGEVITLRYSATVDTTKISANGTVEQTKNTARVTSDQVPDGKEASADFAGQAKFQRVTKTAAGDPVPVGDGLYEQTWTILVNDDHRLPMGGSYIYDWIAQNSRPFMQFNGEGITVHVTFEDGTVETRTVLWSDLYLYTDSNGTIGWRYLAPEADGKATYEITCTTRIKTDGALGNLTLVNGAQVNNSYDEGTTTVGVIGENVFDIQKDAVGTTATESEWKITVTVPGSGLSEMHVTDDAPKLTYEEQDYIDYFQEGSFEIEGLLDGESWNLYIGSSQRSYTITFYKSETQTNSNKGLLPTPDGQPRNIVIHFKTDVNQDWLDLAAEDGYSSQALYKHRNYAAAWSGSYRTPTVNATVIPIRPNLVKHFASRTDVDVDGVTFPVFRYYLELFGPVEDGVTIHDSFHTDYLKFYDAAGIQILGGDNIHPTDGNGIISVTDTSEGMDITVGNFPKQSDGHFYPYYQVSYSLIVKDQDALSALNAAAAASQNGIDLENTASWGSLVSSRVVNYTYFPYVDKELLRRPSADNGYVAEFKVIINPYGEDLDPTSDVLAIQDVLSSNLRFIPDSLTISPANDSIIVQHDDETNTLTFTEVPDNTTFVITYQARVLGSGNVTYSNTIKFGNFGKTVEEESVVESSGGGTASNPSITLVKRDSKTLSTTLAGATFQLFYMENGNRIPVQDRDGQNVTFTTGADGRVLIVGNLQILGWTLWTDRTYCLVEIAAPVGYEINEEPSYFVLTEQPSSQIEFDITGDQLSVKNEPEKISVPVTKTWIGPAGTGPVVVHLLANGIDTGKIIPLTADEDWTGTFDNLRKYDDTGNKIPYSVEEEPMENYAPQYAGSAENGYTISNMNTETIDIPVVKQWVGPAAESVTIHLLADGEVVASAQLTAENNWQGTFTNLPKYDNADGHEIIYDAEEVSVPGYEQERSGSATTGFTFTNTITGKVSIPVTKKWIGPATDSVTVELLADGVKVAEVMLNETNGWQYTFVDLDQYNNGVEIVYAIREISIDGYITKITGGQSGYTITNTITGKVSIPVTKTWIGPAADSVTVELLADGVEVADVMLSTANGWKHTFSNLDKYNNGVEISYTIREASINGYSSKITGNMSDGFVVTNTNTKTIDIPVEKRWVGTEAESVTMKLYADGTKIADTVLNKGNHWRHTFTNLQKYDNTDGHEIVYTITEDAVSGYATSITGDMTAGFVVTNTKNTTPPYSPNTPKTGDASHLLLYVLAMILSGAGLVGALVPERKRTNRQQS